MSFNLIVYGIALPLFIVLALVYYFAFRRNYFNKYKYIRFVQYNKDKTINIKYIKKDLIQVENNALNFDGKYVIVNPDHVFNFKGYTSIITTSESGESIDPLDFKSQYDSKKFQTAMNSKLIQEAFVTLKSSKFDMLTISVFINLITLLTVVYLILKMQGVL
jgi:hypothetical protein